jgi:hypothetical protein
MKTSYNGQPVPANGNGIDYKNGELQVPDAPVIPFIVGVGSGRESGIASRDQRQTWRATC